MPTPRVEGNADRSTPYPWPIALKIWPHGHAGLLFGGEHRGRFSTSLAAQRHGSRQCIFCATPATTYNVRVKSFEVVIIGGGVIGLSLALELERKGSQVAVLERAEPGREASYAAGGMLADHDPHAPELLLPLAHSAAKMYPEWVESLERESGLHIDFRRHGTIYFPADGETFLDSAEVSRLSPEVVAEIEPSLEKREGAWHLPENCIDPRHLTAALSATARKRGIHVETGATAIEVETMHGRVYGVRTERGFHRCSIAVNCAGAWAGKIAPLSFAVRPVKGHMLALVFPVGTKEHPSAKRLAAVPIHVVRRGGCYVIPRSDGRIVVGSTVEEAGFDKTVDPGTIQRLLRAACELFPRLADARIHEAWTGLRPGTPDGLPLLGETSIRHYYACTGHFRDGILLAPSTAQAMAHLITTGNCPHALNRFSPERFT